MMILEWLLQRIYPLFFDELHGRPGRILLCLRVIVRDSFRLIYSFFVIVLNWIYEYYIGFILLFLEFIGSIWDR